MYLVVCEEKGFHSRLADKHDYNQIKFKFYAIVCFVGTMDFGCNFSENDSDCFSSFEGIHIAVTVLHACYAATIILVSIPTCITLFAAMIKYRCFMDNSAFLVESILISDITTAIFLSGQVFITAAA